MKSNDSYCYIIASVVYSPSPATGSCWKCIKARGGVNKIRIQKHQELWNEVRGIYIFLCTGKVLVIVGRFQLMGMRDAEGKGYYFKR